MVHSRTLWAQTIAFNQFWAFPPGHVFCLVKEAGPVPAKGAILDQNVFSNIDLSIDRQHKNGQLNLKFQKSFFMDWPNAHP